MRIAPQGRRFVFGAAAAGAAGLLLRAAAPGGFAACAGLLLAGLGLASAAFCAYFFRDPERATPQDASAVWSPGDGVVLSVAREGPEDAVVIRIFLSVFDVHVQRAPCAGRVLRVEEHPGSFAAAMKDAARGNFRVAMTLEAEGGRGVLVVEQIAGLIARRIECWPKPGESLAAGQRYGIIYFGSQASVRLPPGARAVVEPGRRVSAGLTRIAEWTARP